MFNGFQTDGGADQFSSMFKRNGVVPGQGMATNPGGGFAHPQGSGPKPAGITPPGPNHSREWFGGGGQELTKPTDKPAGGFLGYQPTGKGPGGFNPQPDPAPRGGEGGGNPWIEGGGGYEGGPQGPFTPQGQMGPKGHPMGGPWHGDPFQNRPNPFGPQIPQESPIFPQPQRMPQMSRAQWQQQRVNPMQPAVPQTQSDEFLGRPNGWVWGNNGNF